ncbi:MAG: aminotransferase class III-fold pyridoxal phosphate-dependent enzyme, partial [Rhodothermales bacterium]
ATLATEALFSAFLGDRRNTLYHGHSYTGNPLACAAALANLDLFEDLLPMLPEKERVLSERLEPFHALPYVGDVRRRGFMVGFELVMDKATRHPFPAGALAGYVVADAARERGMLIRPIGNVVIFMPPLASSNEALREMVAILHAAFQAATPALEQAALSSQST